MYAFCEKSIKTYTLIIIIISSIAIMIVGCSANGKTDKTLQTPIVHEIYNYKTQPPRVISIFNSVGDIEVSHSDTDEINVVVQLIQTKKINDLNTKLNSLAIKPKTMGQILYFEPLYTKDLSSNYWKKISNANGIQINFEVQIPDTVKELRIFNEVGNINLQNITARIHAQTNIGDITATNIDPLDSVVFKTNIAQKGIKVSFSTIEFANTITAGLALGSLEINVPNNMNYLQEIKKDMTVEYPHDMYSEQEIAYIRDQCLAKFVPIKTKQGNTIITTVDNNYIIRKVDIEKE